ncbi:hypothetical protein N9N32_00425 [Alphaproteobacteria bacterium]|nr:hypothetical protein [Alphaproteobacteria bacterium]
MSKPKIEFRIIKLGRTPEMVNMRKTHKAAMALWNTMAYENKQDDYIVVKYKDGNADINFIVDFVRAGHKPVKQVREVISTPVPEGERKERPLTNKEVDAMGLTPPFRTDEEAVKVFYKMLETWSTNVPTGEDEDE